MATIVIVDDSTVVLERLRLVLEGAGHRVVTVDTPFGASAAIARNSPDLVLVDVTMPALSGDVLVTIARRRTITQGAKIVLLSDRALTEIAALAESCGADGYIRKTPDHASFLRQVEVFLASKKGS
jgi:two-component system, chemotaxis family, response regulator PixG